MRRVVAVEGEMSTCQERKGSRPNGQKRRTWVKRASKTMLDRLVRCENHRVIREISGDEIWPQRGKVGQCHKMSTSS